MTRRRWSSGGSRGTVRPNPDLTPAPRRVRRVSLFLPLSPSLSLSPPSPPLPLPKSLPFSCASPPVHRVRPRTNAVPTRKGGRDTLYHGQHSASSWPSLFLANFPVYTRVFRAARGGNRLVVATGREQERERDDAGCWQIKKMDASHPSTHPALKRSWAWS